MIYFYLHLTYKHNFNPDTFFPLSSKREEWDYEAVIFQLVNNV